MACVNCGATSPTTYYLKQTEIGLLCPGCRDKLSKGEIDITKFARVDSSTPADSNAPIIDRPDNSPDLIRDISLPIFEGRSAIMFVAILSIIYGVMLVLTLLGILIAWLPIWMGILLIQSSSAIEYARAKGDKQMLVASLSKLKLYFTIQGVLALIGIIVGIIAALVALSRGMVGNLFG
jgi:hypothetical protein